MGRGVARAVDWEAISSHLLAVRDGARPRREPAADPSHPVVDAARVLAFRARATHLGARLPAGSFAEAARGGLQDSAPRDALVALHARIEGVTPDAWEHPTLAQIWFRWADYVVPREDLAVFTRGALPRDARQARALEDLADAIVRALGGEPGAPAAAASRIAGSPGGLFIRSASATGRVLIRWDARTVTLIPSPRPAGDDEAARAELARRFLGRLGPSSPQRFARWAGVPLRDAGETFASIASELTTVALADRARSILASDLGALLEAAVPEGVRLLGQGDPYRTPDPLVRVPDVVVERAGVERRLINSLTGRVMVEGRLVGSWGRRQHRLTVAAWGALPRATRDAIEEEGAALAGPIGRPIDLRWL